MRNEKFKGSGEPPQALVKLPGTGGQFPARP